MSASTATDLVHAHREAFRVLLETAGKTDSIAEFDSRPTWDNPGPAFDNRPTWDNWHKR